MARAGEAELLAQVYAAPDDDAPRLVYADWLQERGDPRGELIALQIERARSKAKSGGRQREDELIAKHLVKWTRELEPEMAWVRVRGGRYDDRPDVELRRGFAAVVTTKRINRHPSWATVTHCNVPPLHDFCWVGALRAVTAAQNDDFVALSKLKRPLAIEELVWGWAHDPTRTTAEYVGVEVPPEVVTAFSKIAVLPKLRRLDLSPKGIGSSAPTPDELAWLLRAPAVAALEELRLPGDQLGAWIVALAPTQLRRFELVMAATNPYGWQAGTRLVVERDGLGFGKVTALIFRSTANALQTLARTIADIDRGVIRSARIAIASKADWDKCNRERVALTKVFDQRKIEGTLEKSSK